MIKILRTSCPACLNKSNHEFVKKDYKREEVINALSGMQHGKCCYCERKINNLGSAERAVEHYIPKSAFKDVNGNFQWHLANKWENLLYACGSCTSSKGSQLPFNSTTGEREIIDPCYEEIDPEDHIDFLIDDNLIFFVERDESSLGRSTIEKLKLVERSDLFGEFRRIKLIIDKQIAELVNASMNNNITSVTSNTNELSRATSAHHPFAAFRRKYIAKRLRELNDQRPRFKAVYGKSFDRIEIDIHKGYETET